MSRLYVNGIGNISFNGTFLSFVLDDTYQGKSGALTKNAVVELITELESAEGICNFLLGEISKIKESQKDNIRKRDGKEKSTVLVEQQLQRPPVGRKINMSEPDH